MEKFNFGSALKKMVESSAQETSSIEPACSFASHYLNHRVARKESIMHYYVNDCKDLLITLRSP